MDRERWGKILKLDKDTGKDRTLVLFAAVQQH